MNALEICQRRMAGIALAQQAAPSRGEAMEQMMQEHAVQSAEPPLPEKPRFNGSDYSRERDDVRLTGQLHRVWNVMADNQWRTLKQIADATGDPEPSISAQLRHLRKPRFGAHQVERKHIADGLYQYRLTPRPA